MSIKATSSLQGLALGDLSARRCNPFAKLISQNHKKEKLSYIVESALLSADCFKYGTSINIELARSTISFGTQAKGYSKAYQKCIKSNRKGKSETVSETSIIPAYRAISVAFALHNKTVTEFERVISLMSECTHSCKKSLQIARLMGYTIAYAIHDKPNKDIVKKLHDESQCTMNDDIYVIFDKINLIYNTYCTSNYPFTYDQIKNIILESVGIETTFALALFTALTHRNDDIKDIEKELKEIDYHDKHNLSCLCYCIYYTLNNYDSEHATLNDSLEHSLKNKAFQLSNAAKF